jgi:hypothetical protein
MAPNYILGRRTLVRVCFVVKPVSLQFFYSYLLMLMLQISIEMVSFSVAFSVADSHHVDADPDPALSFRCGFGSCVFTLMRIRILPFTLMWIQIDADADLDPVYLCDANLDPAYHFDADPDPPFHFNVDPDPQHWLHTYLATVLTVHFIPDMFILYPSFENIHVTHISSLTS